MVRVAAVGDLHLGLDSSGVVAPQLASLVDQADVFLYAGDVTRHGDPAEAAVFAAELESVEIPKIAVLGNHDYHSDQQDLVAKHLEQAGITVLERDSVVLEVDGTSVGVAGAKGFGGGFRDACGSDFGEPEMKAFVRHTKEISNEFEQQLRSVAHAEVTIALLHYSPVPQTLVGEKPEIFPFLGSYLLEDAIDAVGADLALHGHAHVGVSEGSVTAGGTPVHNVAHPVIRAPFRIFEL